MEMITTTKTTLADWATGMETATGAQADLSGGITTTTDDIQAQTLALGENAQAWLAKAAMADTNVQDMFKQFYTVDGPGLGEMAAAAGTKISDIITAALAAPGSGATDYIERNFDMFAAGLEGKGAEVKAALLKIAGSLDTTTAAGVENSKMVEALTEGFGSLGDEVDGAGDVVDTVAEKIRTLTDYVGDLSSIMSAAFTIRYGKTEAVDKLTTAWRELRESIKQAREEIANIQRDINGMQADANILQYQLNIAIKYGDTKRADKLRAELAAKQQEITDKNTEMVKAQGEASTSLTGNSEAAVRNRGTMRGLVQDYNDYLAALANTAQFEGLSDVEVKRKKDFLKAQGSEEKSEFYIPNAVADMVSSGKATEQLVPVESQWFGVTYREDRPLVAAALGELTAKGEYPTPLG
jgi:predicted  nucleic acid-binding Zn-ribbon protein